MNELASFASRLVIIDEGRKAAEGPAAAMLTDTGLLAGHSLDPPGTVELCGLLTEATGAPVAPVLEESQAIELMLKIMEKRDRPSCR
jgi:hypothetical protein